MTCFKSKCVNIASNSVAVVTALLQQMINSGISPNRMNQMKYNVQAMGFDPDAMNIDGDSNEIKKERAKSNNDTGMFLMPLLLKEHSVGV